ncbi:(2Fe-2S) ferredoxin domain-containing protein [Lysinibacillus sp. FSL K6-0057]|jgi:(2Fe-2S) ferredoxin|uniref:(2Fe-2S) ferredoxin domain-containing protein n=1 Tax=Lysinibacillus TaxID=400634 RepID=UPI001966FA83|nr:(2Fe-2S) ferredoxin domain-containing protein [Lysinibacillus fusiformis]QSB09983.1 (2Fe-2S) ferredoxin domain-containing protein [Lysinibacillus fusiformis]
MTTWNLEGMKTHLFICNGSSCMNKDGEEITLAIRDEIQRQALDQEIHTTRTRCNGRCKDACVVIAYPQGNWYRVPSTEHARTLVQDLHHESLYNEHVFTLREGTLQRTAQTTAIKGIEKVKEG